MTGFSSNINYRILWVEQLLYCVVLGIWFHLWLLSLFLFVVLSWLLNRPKGIVYAVYALSLSWGLMAMLCGYFLSGWAWAIGGGVCVLFCSLGIHMRDLQRPFYSAPIKDGNVTNLNPNWPWTRGNLN